MSKRSTTGLPKPAQPKPEAPRGRLQPRLIREYRSKAEREAEIQRLVILGTLIAVGIAVLVLVGAFVNQSLIVPGQSVANVNGTSISVSQFKTRAKLERALLIDQLNNGISLMQSFGYTSDQISQALTSQAPFSTYYSELQVSDQLGNSVLNTMIEDELVRQKAKELGITVTDADTDAQIQKYFGYTPPPAAGAAAPTATPTSTLTPTPLVSPTPSLTPSATPVTPTATPAASETVTPTYTPVPTATASPTPNATEQATEQATQFATQRDSYFANIKSETGLTDADIRAYFEMQALREKVRNAVITDVTHTAPFVDARHILVDNEDDANSALQALQSGDSFAELAKQLSKDSSSTSGGELGWQPVSGYVAEFSDAVATAEVGALVGPVHSQYGYHIIQVRAREDRDLSDNQYEQAINTKFNDYLKNLRSSADTNVQVFDTWTNNVPTDPQFVPNF